MSTPYNIDIKTTADVAGAKQADAAMQGLNKTVERSVDPAKKATEEQRKFTQQAGKLRQAVQGLAIEFPLLARVMAIATNPIAAALLAVSTGIAAFAKGLQRIKDLGKDDSPLGPIIGELHTVDKLTRDVKKATDEYADSLKKTRDSARVAGAKGRLGELEAQPGRVTSAEDMVSEAAKRLEAARVEVARIEGKYGIKDLRTYRGAVRDPGVAAALGGGFESAQRALEEEEQANRYYQSTLNLRRSERERFTRRGLEAGRLQADIGAAAQGEGPLVQNPRYSGPVVSGAFQTVIRSNDEQGAAFLAGLQALAVRQRAQAQLARQATMQIQNQRTP